MEYLTTTETAQKWGISARRVAVFCKEQRIAGAVKKGKTWLIPEDAVKPEDARCRGNQEEAALDGEQHKQELYMRLEQKFPVVYPESERATYTSLLNYSDDLDKPFQRWYRYKEGFSVELVQHLIREYARHKKGKILDPFSGSGSTLLAARDMGYEGVGFEVNPFSCFLSKCKLDVYERPVIDRYKECYEDILRRAWETERKHEKLPYQLPKLSISEKVFSKELEGYYMAVGSLIEDLPQETEERRQIKALMKLGWLACLEPLCNYRKAGNGLKYRRYVKPRVITAEEASIALLEEYQNIYIDLLKSRQSEPAQIYPVSCLEMGERLGEESVEGIIFSPPYANCFDYTEIYKLELWFGGFVQDYEDLKKLRRTSLHSHLNGDLSAAAVSKSVVLEKLLKELEGKKLWDKKIPQMLRLYYEDMFAVLDQSYRVLKKKGFCCIVVGNSAYGGVIFPADLILAEYAASIGFTVDKIEVDRYMITSSQQYEITKETGKYLRESVVCLVKNK